MREQHKLLHIQILIHWCQKFCCIIRISVSTFLQLIIQHNTAILLALVFYQCLIPQLEFNQPLLIILKEKWEINLFATKFLHKLFQRLLKACFILLIRIIFQNSNHTNIDCCLTLLCFPADNINYRFLYPTCFYNIFSGDICQISLLEPEVCTFIIISFKYFCLLE